MRYRPSVASNRIAASGRGGPDDCLVDLGERHFARHAEQQQVVPLKGFDDVAGHLTEHGLTSGQTRSPRCLEVRCEGLTVLRIGAPHQAAHNQFPAASIATGVDQIRGVRQSQRAVQARLVAVQQAQREVWHSQQIAHLHQRNIQLQVPSVTDFGGLSGSGR